MKVKYYIAGILSNIALVLYSLPWTYSANHASLGFYLIAFFWFMFAWVFILIHLAMGIILKLDNDRDWKHHLVAIVLIVISYIGFFIMKAMGYSVTV